VIIHQTSSQEIVIWGLSLPTVALEQADINYLKKVASLERPPIEWIWKEMDRVWNALGLENHTALQGQAIGEFYSHPIWVINGVFSAVDSVSVKHRDSIAEFVSRIGVKRAADYGGGFGELALRLHVVNLKIQIDIVEPYPSKLGMLRVAGKTGIQFVNELDGEYDCVIAQDVLEHVEDPIRLACKIAAAVRVGGVVIFANCFYPVIQCHLPSTFHLRHTFPMVMRAHGLRYLGRVEGASHAQIFKRTGRLDIMCARRAERISRMLGSALNFALAVRARLKRLVMR
jgi:2-polyprenyl-3-methyl-5-hydroxy-6-metoxy-1,4-benzoquinol methylase